TAERHVWREAECNRHGRKLLDDGNAWLLGIDTDDSLFALELRVQTDVRHNNKLPQLGFNHRRVAPQIVDTVGLKTVSNNVARLPRLVQGGAALINVVISTEENEDDCNRSDT